MCAIKTNLPTAVYQRLTPLTVSNLIETPAMPLPVQFINDQLEQTLILRSDYRSKRGHIIAVELAGERLAYCELFLVELENAPRNRAVWIPACFVVDTNQVVTTVGEVPPHAACCLCAYLLEEEKDPCYSCGGMNHQQHGVFGYDTRGNEQETDWNQCDDCGYQWDEDRSQGFRWMGINELPTRENGNGLYYVLWRSSISKGEVLIVPVNDKWQIRSFGMLSGQTEGLNWKPDFSSEDDYLFNTPIAALTTYQRQMDFYLTKLQVIRNLNPCLGENYKNE